MAAPPTASASTAASPMLASSPSLHWSKAAGWTAVTETLAVEAPLAIEIAYERGPHPIHKVLGVTMRTPGHDEELALGFLLAEGLIAQCEDVVDTTALPVTCRDETIATQRVQLARAPREDLQRMSRALLTSSACGLCGRASLEGMPQPARPRAARDASFACSLVARLPDALRHHQPLFFETGGSHGAAIADADGSILITREDVGRHNAVDKALGAALRQGLPLGEKILVLSGRASFELLQKATVAGLPLVVAVGAPSSLAVDLAHRSGITLVGFTREGRFNAYTHADRLTANASA